MITRFIKKSQRFRGFFLVSVVYFLLATFLTGCSDPRYLSEKLFYQAEKEVVTILKRDQKQLSKDNFDKVIAIYRKVVKTCPLENSAAKAQIIIANMYASRGKYREAQKEFKLIIQNFSSQPKIASSAQFAIGKLYESQGKWDKAIIEYEKVMDLYPLTSLGLNMPGYILKHYRNINDLQGEKTACKKAIKYYNKLIDEFSETSIAPAIQDYLASLYLSQGDFKEALKVWDKIIETNPDSKQIIKAFLSKGEIYAQKLKDIPKAIEVYEEFIKKYPRHKILVEFKLRLTQLYLADSQTEKARNSYLALLKNYPDDEQTSLKASIGLAYCYRKEANTNKVIEIYETIKENYPDTEAGLSIPFLIAQYYQELKYSAKAEMAYQKALFYYEKVLEDDEKKEEIKREAAAFLALCHVKKKQWDKALELLRMLADKYPGNPMYLLDIAMIYRNLHALDKAIAVYEELKIKYPNNNFILNLSNTQIKSLKERETLPK